MLNEKKLLLYIALITESMVSQKSSYTLGLLLLLASFVMPAHRLLSQTDTPPVKDSSHAADDDMKVFEKVEIEASYPGGHNAWKKFLEQNLNAAVAANKKAPAGAYTVVIQFVVDKEGKISDIKPLTNHGYGMEDEVIRILKKASRWQPAIQDGRPVKAYRKQPVTFMVIEDKKWKKNTK